MGFAFGFSSLLSANYTDSGRTLLRRLTKARQEAEKQVHVHIAFTAALPAHLVERWTTMVEEWESDRTKPSPYLNKVKR